MSTNPQISYRMLTPLVRIKINTSEKLHFHLNDQLQIIINDKTVFPQWNNMQVDVGQTTQILPGISAMSFNRDPLLLALCPFVDDYPDAATRILDFLLKGFALFKTTLDTKFKLGPRIVHTLDSTPNIRSLNLRGSDDFSEFTGKIYEINMSELKMFKDFYSQFESQLNQITDKKFLESLEFFTKATRTSNDIEKFIFLSISFEFLFSKEDSELSYRFSNRIALLLGDDSVDRIRIGKVIKNVIYRQRSKIIHGASVVTPPKDILQYFFEVMRISLLRFISLYRAGHVDPISELDSFLLLQDTTEYEKFRNDAVSLFDDLSNLKFNMIRTKVS